MSENEVRCKVCGGPHETRMHYDWVEMPLEMRPEDIRAELVRYTDILDALKTGGMAAAYQALRDMGLSPDGETCFCGTPNHTAADHLRWLLDKEGEMKE